ncbi:C40 family peptidase [Streptomyces lavendulae]|uniref:C40 family peptidase n=1 Tax=Streptomyces lavendulae TaxID=1914 RepID=UPI00382FC98D
MRTPEFTDVIPEQCDCVGCGSMTAGNSDGPAVRRRRTARGAVVAAIGAAVLAGTGAGTASAEPAPAGAGWDGSKYWYKDATGWWRWTSHHDKYLARTGQPDGGGGPRTDAGSAGPRTSEPVFRGRQGWDPTDRVYWYERGGSWWWTSHKDKYQRYTGGSTAGGGSGASSGSVTSASGTPVRHGTEAAVAFAMNHLGDPYAWGGNGPHAWDCSGLVQAAYRSAGISLPRVADDQYRMTTPLTRSELRRGDLVFWSDNGRASGIHHVALYLGGGQYLEAPRPGKNVRISSFAFYEPNMYGRIR